MVTFDQLDMSAEFVVYSDFNCPFCYVLNERIIAAGITDLIMWRGVQHAPHLPIPMAQAAAALTAELEDEVRAIRRLAPEIAIALPRGKPNTLPGIQAVAAALRFDERRAHAFKNALYREFWQYGSDISDPTILQKCAQNAGFPDEIDVSTVELSISTWQREWGSSGLSGVPALIHKDGKVLVWLVSVEDILNFVKSV